jgi:hypothetical protein
MAYVAMRPNSAIIVEVLVPTAVPAEYRSDFEEAAVEFLLGRELLRPELLAELTKRGININALTAAYDEPVLAVCPTLGDRQFIPGPALMRLASSSNISFTGGGSIHIDFLYDQASKMEYPSNVLFVRLRVPESLVSHMTDEVIGEIVSALFGNCDLPPRVKAFLAAHGLDLNELARQAHQKFSDGSVPPTTRVNELAARRLERAGLNVAQFGTLKVLEVTAIR